TVSPVPLVATAENRHALVATTYSKSVLRVVAEEVARTDSRVEYFPSYEIITGSYSRGRYFESDLRSVTPEGVAHVMRVFMKHFSSAGSPTDQW
ncbi:MAG: GSCFA domain-containing protein, partial [Pseudomonadota bacterium]